MVKDQKHKRRSGSWAGVPIPLRCIGCPYPKVGIICRSSDGTCTRTDMEQLDLKKKVMIKRNTVY